MSSPNFVSFILWIFPNKYAYTSKSFTLISYFCYDLHPVNITTIKFPDNQIYQKFQNKEIWYLYGSEMCTIRVASCEYVKHFYFIFLGSLHGSENSLLRALISIQFCRGTYVSWKECTYFSYIQYNTTWKESDF